MTVCPRTDPCAGPASKCDGGQVTELCVLGSVMCVSLTLMS